MSTCYPGVYSSFTSRNDRANPRYGIDSNHKTEIHKIDRQQRVTATSEIAVTRMQRWNVAVRPRWPFSVHSSAKLTSLLRQKPTSIEGGFPVGTKGLDRRPPAGGSFSSTPEGIEVARGDILKS
jgi:hypothetical protein